MNGTFKLIFPFFVCGLLFAAAFSIYAVSAEYKQMKDDFITLVSFYSNSGRSSVSTPMSISKRIDLLNVDNGALTSYSIVNCKFYVFKIICIFYIKEIRVKRVLLTRVSIFDSKVYGHSVEN